jgi:putative DNA primase/helicase
MQGRIFEQEFERLAGELRGLHDFHPEHLADLAKSGLNAATIRELGIYPVPVSQIATHLGYDNKEIKSLVCFPYPGVDGFCRDKVFPAIKDKKGHTIRYLQRKDSGSHLYIPPLVRVILNDPSVTLYLTEGEKKAAKACQEGFPCIGLGGLWNWLQDGHPIPDLDLVVWSERRVALVPDSDVWSREDLLHAVFALGAELESRGAYVRVLRLPRAVYK